MNILVVGSGGREHALIWKLKQSDKVRAIHCAPGNAGIADLATCHPELSADNISGLVQCAVDHAIDLVLVGPEVPLTLGLVDACEKKGIKAFGPNARAAELEGSKRFMKDLCAKKGIPTALYKTSSDVDEALAFLEGFGSDVVIKADGLAAGKGVVIPETLTEAKAAVVSMLSGKAFGEAGREVVIEEFLEGQEVSFFALTDGKTVIPFGTAEDHKRAFDDDKGPNTGGMGAFSPSSLISAELEQTIMNRIIQPTIEGLDEQGIHFKGVLYAGLILVDGEPKLLEYNVRFGDPECQVLMMRLESDLAEIIEATASGRLESVKDLVNWSTDPALTVVMAASGYPESYAKNTMINGADALTQSDKFQVFHAGTSRDGAGNLVNTGGRVLNVTAREEDISAARSVVYSKLKQIDWPEGFYRDDIGIKKIRQDAA